MLVGCTTSPPGFDSDRTGPQPMFYGADVRTAAAVAGVAGQGLNNGP